jgi:glycerol-3-phosphate dehydrogenase (NAD(P)+)
MKNNIIALLGAGSWGTAVAIHFARHGHDVLLWGHNKKQIEQMQIERQNLRYLPDITFPETLKPHADLDYCLATATTVIIAVPSHAFVDLLKRISTPLLGLAWLTKGLDPESHKLLNALVAERFGNNFPVAVISGPSFAKEVAQGLPTAITLASNNTEFQHSLQKLLHREPMRVYLTDDIIGVQLCGAVKNVLAIACGISDGLGHGANAKAALITRGLAEMSRLGLKMGANSETFIGLAGVGDLVLTCTDDQSRNRRFGLQLGLGANLEDAEKSIGQVVEGKHNAAQVCALANTYHIEMPICEQVNALLLGKVSAKIVTRNLMNRPARGE